MSVMGNRLENLGRTISATRGPLGGRMISGKMSPFVELFSGKRGPASPVTRRTQFANPHLVRAAVRDICAEMERSFTLRAIWRWMQRNRDNKSKLTGLFCTCACVCPHLRLDSEVSCFVKSEKANVYRQAAKQIPTMILLASFGEFSDVLHMRMFLQQWQHAEQSQRDEDLEMLGAFDETDHGPLLFWLVNASDPWSSRQVYAPFCNLCTLPCLLCSVGCP
jgi:hypothetical protein